MFKRFAQILLLILFSTTVFSQQKLKIDLKPKKQTGAKAEIVKNISNGLVISETIYSIELIEIETEEGFYSQMLSDGMSKTFNAGKPDLPVINRLIEIPFNSEAKVRVISYDEETIDLKEYNLTKLIIPAQPSVAKNKDKKDEPFIKDNAVYKKNDFFKNEFVKFEDKGYLRDKHLAYIEISPFAYNPVTNTLKALNNIEIEILFIPKKNVKSQSIDKLKSPYFESLTLNTINEPEDSKALIGGPVKYVIVSDPMFKETLQPFIEWKTMKGFNVIEAYTNVIGTTTTEIKSYLKDLYDNPSDGVSHSFVLIVGDVAQVPAFSGTEGGHKTDLYYGEYTGDKLPEVYYGRFSAETIEELQPQIDKTLEIEKYEMPDPSYLNNVVLVAGVDGTYASTRGNGVINYANDYYTNEENGVTSYYYLYNDASGVMASNNTAASSSIRGYISEGVSFTNYTAHCGSSGWSDPSFNISHIEGLTNEHMYPLIIGNCCQSNTFNDNDCFGEKLLMAVNKGAVGYIGGSNLTYWDEDYWWGVGLTSTITADPTYENSGLGAYDRFFHLNGESKQDWYITQGQINVAGNLAVEASSSSLKEYYWEIYHLMGDPSLTPYVSVPKKLLASYDTEIVTGSSVFEVIAEENAYVAISKNGKLLDARLVDATGYVQLSFNPISEPGLIDLVITKQNRQPLIDQITALPASTPYVILDYYSINDALGNNNNEVDYGETIKLDIQLKNLSNTYDAFNVNAVLSSSDTNLIITDFIQDFGAISTLDSALVNMSFTIDLKDKFTDQQNIDFNLEIFAEDLGGYKYNWSSKIALTVNAPEMEIGNLIIDDQAGNNNNILDPGETADILLVLANKGSAKISNLNGFVSILGGGETFLTLNNTETGSFSILPQDTDTLRFSASAASGTSEGTIVYLGFEIDDVTYNYYSKSISKELNIGEIPEILISDEGTTILGKAYFYDTGGKTGNYLNNENYTITLKPKDLGSYIAANFLSFNVESHTSCDYDKLMIYNGSSIEDELIGKYCGTNSPGFIVASNIDGALTFVFTSDNSVDKSGWEAEIRSLNGVYQYTVTVLHLGNPIEGAIVEFDGKTEITGTDGIANFYEIPKGINYPLKITAVGYDVFESSINLFENTVDEYSLNVSKYDVTFYLTDEDEPIDGEISFDGKILTTQDGELIFHDVEYSLNKTYFIQSYGYADSTASLEVTSNLSEKIALKAFKYNVKFVISDGANPINGALVEFDNKEILTDNGISIFEQVKMDSMLHYVVRKTGYNNVEGTIDLKRDSTVNLIMSAGKATFKVSFEVFGVINPIYNAQIILDSDTLYTDPSGNAVFENVLEAENISYIISKDHFNDIKGTIDVMGKNVIIDTNLTYKSYEIVFNIKYGEDPLEGAIISFDGKSGDSDANGQCVFEVTYSLNRLYRVIKYGFNDLTGMINITENKTIELGMLLKTYNVTFMIVDGSLHAIENVLVEFNNESIVTNINGEAVFSEIIPGEHFGFTLSKEGFWDYDSTLSVVDADVVFNARLSSTTGVMPIIEDIIKIYPNPSNGLFNLEISGTQDEVYQIKVFNVIGTIVYVNTVTGSSFIKEQIDLSQKSKGMYFISIESDNGAIISKRIIIK